MSYKHAKHAWLVAGLLVAAPAVAFAQGTVRGAEEGADTGAHAGGAVGAAVGGAVGAAAGTVGGVVGAGEHGCQTETTHRENGEGDSSTTRRTNCP